jgi:hypothetical protein
MQAARWKEVPGPQNSLALVHDRFTASSDMPALSILALGYLFFHTRYCFDDDRLDRFPITLRTFLAPVVGGAASPPALVFLRRLVATGFPAGRGLKVSDATVALDWFVTIREWLPREDIPPVSQTWQGRFPPGGLHTTTCRSRRKSRVGTNPERIRGSLMWSG